MPKPADFGEVMFMRHPQTRANIEDIFSGQKDVDLTAQGEQELVRAIDAAKSWKPERIFTSPLKRTRSIAEPVAEALGIPIEVDERLIELNFGPLEGVSVPAAAKNGIVFPWSFDEVGVSQPPCGAESFEHIISRAKLFVDSVAQYSGKTLCVTHGGFTRALFAAVYSIPAVHAWDFEFFNVTSQLFLSDGKKLYLCSSGLLPEEVIARSKDR